MTPAPPEWSHRVAVRDVPPRGLPVTLSASAAERQALARRLGLVALSAFTVDALLEPVAGGLRLTGTLHARLSQRCVVSLEPVEAEVEAPLAIEYRAGDAVAELDETADPLAAGPDIEPLAGGAIDVADAAVQSLSLALDPYPRAPDADAAARTAGIVSEAADAAARSPFAVLGAGAKPGKAG